MMAKEATSNQTQRLENKQALARKSFRYTRFLPLRYSLALFSFTNLYWALLIFGLGFAWLIPAGMVLLGLPALFEQVKLYGVKTLDLKDELKFTQMFFRIQLLVNVALIAVALSGLGFGTFYPFLTTIWRSRLIMASILGVGVLLTAFGLKRISQILTNTDKHYTHIVKMEAASALNVKGKK